MSLSEALMIGGVSHGPQRISCPECLAGSSSAVAGSVNSSLSSAAVRPIAVRNQPLVWPAAWATEKTILSVHENVELSAGAEHLNKPLRRAGVSPRLHRRSVTADFSLSGAR
ncbi:MAG: hypothetical protein MZV63_53575 [Marinilabiliales bacterium]|nr:hypothetical protein [Marinilabiliales bacterium]